MLATGVDGRANLAIRHTEFAPPDEEPLTASGVVALALEAVDLAGRYLYLEEGTDPHDPAAIAALFAEGVAFESTDPDYEEETYK